MVPFRSSVSSSALQDFASNWKIFLCLNLNPNLFNLPSRFKLEFSYHWMYPIGLFTEVIGTCKDYSVLDVSKFFSTFLGIPTNLIRVILWISRANAKHFRWWSLRLWKRSRSLLTEWSQTCRPNPGLAAQIRIASYPSHTSYGSLHEVSTTSLCIYNKFTHSHVLCKRCEHAWMFGNLCPLIHDFIL